jgi:2-polyprenyl-3-methyl-5-hydroxy-6-metoxy-1,4-benzoquinol methylase
MDRYQETFETWNKVAELYQDKFMNLPLYNDTYDIFTNFLTKANFSSILEIGCGPGNITKYLLTNNSNLKIKGIDISENMIELARKNNPSAEFELMDCRDIHSLDNKFDAIVCGFCIPYLSQSDCLKMIVDCKNLLNDSGILYVSFVDGDYDNSGFISGSSGDRTYFYYHSIDFIESVLKVNCFQTEELIHKKYKKADGTEEIHTILISKKHTQQSF